MRKSAPIVTGCMLVRRLRGSPWQELFSRLAAIDESMPEALLRIAVAG